MLLFWTFYFLLMWNSVTHLWIHIFTFYHLQTDEGLLVWGKPMLNIMKYYFPKIRIWRTTLYVKMQYNLLSCKIPLIIYFWTYPMQRMFIIFLNWQIRKCFHSNRRDVYKLCMKSLWWLYFSQGSIQSHGTNNRRKLQLDQSVSLWKEHRKTCCVVQFNITK